MHWSIDLTLFAFPCFVVKKPALNDVGEKVFDENGNQVYDGRPVIDIRGLNQVVIQDSYPLPRQEDIIALAQGRTRFVSVDGVFFFY